MQRYSDFVVREITKDGTVARLTSVTGHDLEKRWFPGTKPVVLDSAAIDAIASELTSLVEIETEVLQQFRRFLADAASKSDDCLDSLIGRDFAQVII